MTDDSQTREEARAWFIRLQEPTASEADWMEFIAWIEASSERRDAYDEVERTWVEAEALRDAEIRQARPIVANDAGPGVFSGSRRWALPAVAVAAAAVLVVAAWPTLMGPPVASYAAEDQARTVTLADGSTVWLNRHSAIEARVGTGRRDIILLQGEAAFDVTHDPARPFTVSAGDRSVHVLGTAFDVVHQGDRFMVQVARGSVAVTPAGRDDSVRLSVGQSLRQTGKGAVNLSTVRPQTVAARQDGILVYRDAVFGEVVDDLSLYISKPVIADHGARKLRFTGVLNADDEVTVLDQLEAFAPVRIERGPSEVRISSRTD